MDDVILTVFVSFVILLFIAGFWKKQNLLVMLSGIGFSLVGVFINRGITYKASSTITTINSTVTQVVYNYSTWSSGYKTELLIFFLLLGLFIIWLSISEYLKTMDASNTPQSEDDDGDD